jgi:hypothetical protein
MATVSSDTWCIYIETADVPLLSRGRKLLYYLTDATHDNTPISESEARQYIDAYKTEADSSTLEE